MAEQVARAGKSSAKHLSQDISEALRERRWTEAATLLAELSRTSATNVKLGSLQRWTRDADACVDDDKAQWRALLWLLCRVAAGEAADAPLAQQPPRLRAERLARVRGSGSGRGTCRGLGCRARVRARACE